MPMSLFWWMAALVAVVQTTLAQHQEQRSLENGTANWPLLRFHVKVKRSSVKVHGQSDFTVLANPVVLFDDTTGTSVLYDSCATFTEDLACFNYTMANGVSYFSRSNNGGSSATSIQCYEQGCLKYDKFEL
ncbi:hypothetical protein PC113_g14691 [Phytophthora cactorum]|uniref:Uncharacterized protein n=1 Tax=Phytophthora cactorum TaxID=29920 RepID=A0A8T0YSU4_9STRA|nr:hypothetical protein PC113_g14691 [Phytophthora cactorum]